ncbi:MvdC/MvdD family ATP grasp protein [Streptomyces sp. NPDC047315]|uniref:MvdC/MvdD family ATP grasp protein n=1 Tax=Streptomyces sp. NPDC047315 TaxID=3155142 RepID=UPI0033CFA4B0
MPDSPTVLVITSLEDVTTDLVLNELYGRGVPVVRLDPAVDFPDLASISAQIEGARLAGDLTTPTRRLDLSAVRSVYWRRPSPYGDTSRVTSPEQKFAVEQCRAGYTGILTALPALHVNDLFRNRAADYKPAQLTTAARCGFTVPKSIVTNAPAEARKFVAAHGAVIYKPVHGVHLTDEKGRSRTVWTSLVGVHELDDSIALCPHLFQT